jgi:hypothetical protein
MVMSGLENGFAGVLWKVGNESQPGGLLAELVRELLGVSMEAVPQNHGFLPHRNGKLRAF